MGLALTRAWARPRSTDPSRSWLCAMLSAEREHGNENLPSLPRSSPWAHSAGCCGLSAGVMMSATPAAPRRRVG
eukprot:5957927-Alexandrium_andersonii.AAC.1